MFLYLQGKKNLKKFKNNKMKSLINNQINNFKKKGVIQFNNIFNKEKCNDLYNRLINNREWGAGLFRSEKDVTSNPQFKKLIREKV